MSQDEQLQSAIREIQERLDALKRENPSQYERALKDFIEALEDFNRDLRSA